MNATFTAALPDYPQSEITNRQHAKNAKIEVAHWGEKNETGEGSHEPVFAFFDGEIETSHPWRPWRHGGSRFLGSR
jgi:hypothetical protein